MKEEENKVTQEHLKAMKEDWERKMREMQETITKDLKMGKQFVEDRPLLATGLAFGVGLAIGAAIAVAISKGKD